MRKDRYFPDNLKHTPDGLLEWKEYINLQSYFGKMNIEYDMEEFRKRREQQEKNPFRSNGVYHLNPNDINDMFGEDERAYRLIADTDFDVINLETNEIRHVCAGDRGGFMTPDSIIETKDGVPAGWVFDDAKLIGTSIHFSEEFYAQPEVYPGASYVIIADHAVVADSKITADVVTPVFVGEDALIVNSNVSKCHIFGQATVYGANTSKYRMDDWGTDMRDKCDIADENVCNAVCFNGETILYDNNGRFLLGPSQTVYMDDTIIIGTNLNALFAETDPEYPLNIDLEGSSILAGAVLSCNQDTASDMHRRVFSSMYDMDLAENQRQQLIKQIKTRFKTPDDLTPTFGRGAVLKPDIPMSMTLEPDRPDVIPYPYEERTSKTKNPNPWEQEQPGEFIPVPKHKPGREIIIDPAPEHRPGREVLIDPVPEVPNKGPDVIYTPEHEPLPQQDLPGEDIREYPPRKRNIDFPGNSYAEPEYGRADEPEEMPERKKRCGLEPDASSARHGEDDEPQI